MQEPGSEFLAEDAGVPAGERRRGDRRVGQRRRRGGGRTIARAMFYGHLWLAVATTAFLIIVSVTGVLLNHKRGLGYMPDVPAASAAPLANSLKLAELVGHAARAVAADVAAAGVDRMDVRPADNYVKVRFDDARVTEVTVELSSGRVLHVGERNDVFLEKLHSGEIFGSRGVLLSDLVAMVLVLLVLSGFWMWLYPKVR